MDGDIKAFAQLVLEQIDYLDNYAENTLSAPEERNNYQWALYHCRIVIKELAEIPLDEKEARKAYYPLGENEAKS